MAIAVVIIAWGQGSAHSRYYLTSQGRQIGLDLLKTTNSPQLVRMGVGLEGRLSSMFITNAGVAQVLLGDASSPIGNGKASCRLILTNASGDSLGIRLRADSGKFHVLGYYGLTP